MKKVYYSLRWSEPHANPAYTGGVERCQPLSIQGDGAILGEENDRAAFNLAGTIKANAKPGTSNFVLQKTTMEEFPL